MTKFLVIAVCLCHFFNDEATTKPLTNEAKDGSVEGGKWFEVYRNAQSDSNLVEGDMLPEPLALDRERRAVSTAPSHKWDNNIVPYAFDQNQATALTSNVQTLIRSSLDHIEGKTCIRFVPRTTERNYVLFTRETGCFSYVGNIRRGGQRLSIGDTCNDFSVIVHEVLHALGFIHEHTRLDRDQYVYINNSNIQSGLESQFDIYTVNRRINEISTLDTKYDKFSVMHYSRFTFTNKADPVTRAVLPLKEYMTIYSLTDYREVLGSRNGLSTMDTHRVNIHYNCPQTTTTTTTSFKETQNPNQPITDNVGTNKQSTNSRTTKKPITNDPVTNRQSSTFDQGTGANGSAVVTKITKLSLLQTLVAILKLLD